MNADPQRMSGEVVNNLREDIFAELLYNVKKSMERIVFPYFEELFHNEMLLVLVRSPKPKSLSIPTPNFSFLRNRFLKINLHASITAGLTI